MAGKNKPPQLDSSDPTRHKCAALGCAKIVPGVMLMCSYHWQMVDGAQRARVYDTARRGLKLPDPERNYAIARAMIDVASAEGKQGLVLAELQKSNAKYEAQKGIERRAARMHEIAARAPSELLARLPDIHPDLQRAPDIDMGTERAGGAANGSA